MGWTYVEFPKEGLHVFFEDLFGPYLRGYYQSNDHIWIKVNHVVYCVLINKRTHKKVRQLGFRVISQDEGPYEYDCPPYFIDKDTCLGPYGKIWHERVLQYHMMSDDPKIEAYLTSRGEMKVRYLGEYTIKIKCIRTGYRVTFSTANGVVKDYHAGNNPQNPERTFLKPGYKGALSCKQMWKLAYQKIREIAEDMGYYAQS